MLKPVQRIPQYRLLLEDYLRHLSQTSPDWDDTRAALKIVRDVADHANRSIQLGVSYSIYNWNDRIFQFM
jgi:FYVE/RhoGEF/PH domain-containing protein 5/6